MLFLQPEVQFHSVGPWAYVDVILDEFVVICLCNHFSVEGCGCVRHGANLIELGLRGLVRPYG